MTNRERLLQTNEYDLLIRMQNTIERTDGTFCVLDLVTGSYVTCKFLGNDKEHPCEKCIQQWLNELEE